MVKCSAVTKKGRPCKNNAKYQDGGQVYCGSHYRPKGTVSTEDTAMSPFDRKIMQLFGTDISCDSTIVVSTDGTVYKTNSRSVCMSGDCTVRIDNTDPITVSGSYVLKFCRDILLLKSAIDSMEVEDEQTVYSIKYRGIVTLIRSEEKYISYDEWSKTSKLDTGDTVVDYERTKYIVDATELLDGHRSSSEPEDGPIHDILKTVRRGQSIFITGEAGTGKSYNIGLLTRILDSYEKTSSTGTSAHHIGGRTIHSFSGLGVTNIKDFLEKIEDNTAANYRSYEKYLKYRELYKFMGVIHTMKSVQTIVKREQIYMYILILYRYIEFMYPSSRYSERLTAIHKICNTTRNIVGSTSIDTIKSVLHLTANMADTISMKYLSIETNALLKLAVIGHYDVLTRILNKIAEYRLYDPAYRINEVQYLIVDEVSMLSNYDMEMLDWQMRTMRNTLDRFMGGVVMIFVGDLLQLAPVCNKRTTPDVIIDSNDTVRVEDIKIKDIGVWTFGDILKKKRCRHRCSYVTQYTEWMRNISVRILTKNYRQSTDTQFKDILNSIRVGTVDTDCKRLLNSRVVTEIDDNAVVLYGRNIDCDNRNNQCLNALDTNRRVYDAEYSIKYTRNTLLGATESICSEYTPSIVDKVNRAASRYKRVLELKVGAKVMLLSNLSVQYGLVNGALGTVTYLDDSTVTVQFELIEVSVPKRVERVYDSIDRDNETDRYIKTEIYMKQYPLTLAYGITIHKSQGNTYDNMVISMTTDDIWNNDYGKAYVALSRCRTLEGLRLLSTAIPYSRFVADKKIVSLYKYWTEQSNK